MENSTVLNKISAQEQLSILSEVKKDAFVQKLNEYGHDVDS